MNKLDKIERECRRRIRHWQKIKGFVPKRYGSYISCLIGILSADVTRSGFGFPGHNMLAEHFKINEVFVKKMEIGFEGWNTNNRSPYVRMGYRLYLYSLALDLKDDLQHPNTDVSRICLVSTDA